ncbi:MAG: hypothetical protein JO257_11575 [Deltaproteobacteria bacterium]|nr:hypothetical protein [Deltaproteobacteria bacterium]
MRWLFDRNWWERAVLGVIAALVAYQVFAEPIVGTADNRDWWRVTKQMGIDYLPSPGPDATFFKNIQREYRTARRQDVKYLTPEVPLGRVAVVVSRPFSHRGRFDLRWMGAVHSVAYLGAVWLFIAAFRRRERWVRIAVGAFAIVTLTDARIVAYFNSFYCECAQTIFLIASLGLALMLVDDALPPRRRLVCYGSFIVTSLLFFFAKTQDLVFCFPFAALAYWLCPPRVARWWVKLGVVALMLGAFVYGMKSDAYAVTNNINVAVTLGEEILPHSDTPDEDLQELGNGDRANVTFTRIAAFYAKRPLRWWRMAARRLHEAFTHLPLGNFEVAQTGNGETNAYEQSRFDVFSAWKDRHYPRVLWFWIVMIALYAVALVAKVRLGTSNDRSLAIINAMLVIGCILEFIAVVTFEANGTEKHFFIFNVLVDFVILLGVFELVVVARLLRQRQTA